jgi:signal transduction histidine kinase
LKSASPLASRTAPDVEVLKAFRSHEAEERITNTQIGCILVVTLMPAGTLLDKWVYPEHLWSFFQVRLICSAIAALIWVFLCTGLGKRCVRPLGLVVPLLPVVFIAWMIAATEGFESSYYAGLMLVLLAIGMVLQWTTVESLVTVILVLMIYGIAGLLNGRKPEPGVLVNNLYFIVLMDVIVVVGTYVQSRMRFREFALRFELDRNRQMLEQSHRRLLELDKVKSRFFANISHELRTPLTLLLAPLETLLHRPPIPFEAETRALLVTMHTNGMRLLRLINDLLELVRLESGKTDVRREPLAVDEFIRGLVSAARQLAADKRIRLEASANPEVGLVMADRDKLEKVLLNLLFNGLKFTPAGGSVLLEAGRRGEELVLTVRDTGVGIAAANLPYIFDRFWQADNSSRRKHQGAGIGLALVKELTEIQGGRVTVESREGAGTTFTVSLPFLQAAPQQAGEREGETTRLAAAARARPDEWLASLYRRAEMFPALAPALETAPPPATAEQDDRPRVLVADDEPDMLRFLRSQLGVHYQMLDAVDGQQAIEKAGQFLPDIILLDMMMPEKDGLQTCREIRQAPLTQTIPIILLTARADEETKLAALSVGASDFLAKPFSTTELHVRIRNLVESHSFQKRLSRQNQVLENTLAELKETQTQLVQSEKLASLGRLSAGIIHEINNPLNFATTGLYTLHHKTKHLAEDQRADYAEVLKDVEEGLTRVRTIISDLRTFTHPDATHVDDVGVSEAVSSALRFTSDQWRDKVRIEQAVPDRLVIQANRNKVVQVLVNLLQNSLDSLRGKQFANGEEPAIRITGQAADGKTTLAVRDNGDGIAAENLDKIFDPFFTTKDVGRGMGLGLSICYSIVQECGGQIRAQSEPGQFCEFTLEFPARPPK